MDSVAEKAVVRTAPQPAAVLATSDYGDTPKEVSAVQTQAEQLLAILPQLCSDPRVDVAKLDVLVRFMERTNAKQAEMAFSRDFSAASAKMPRVAKNGTIKLVKDGQDKGSIPFARYEDLDTVIRPIEVEFGFTRSFITAPAEQPGILMTVMLSHRAGHSITSTRFMPPDPGPGRNAMQAIGSASSYAKRYLTLDIWNIITEGADDDGHGSSVITPDQARNIEDMMAACDMSADSRKKFLKFAGAATIAQIQQRDYERAMGALRTKEKQVREMAK